MKTDVDQAPDQIQALPRRDLILLPLISLLTMILLMGAAEIGTRLIWPEEKADSCLAKHGELGYRASPNCISHTKAAEGPWVENHYNDCGLLSRNSCRAPVGDRLRLAAVGSSISFTYLVPWDQSWQGLTAARLSKMCGRPVDYQNYAGLYNLNESAMRAPEAAATHPQAAVMFIDTTDLFQDPPADFDLNLAAHLDHITPLPGHLPGLAGLRDNLQFKRLKADSRAALIGEHFAFKSGRTYLDLYLRNGDKADFLRPPFTPAWRRRLAVLDKDLGYMADQLRAQNAPLLVVYVPQQAQAELISGLSGPGTDPYAINKAIGDIARRHGATFIDASPRFLSVRDVPSYFYPVDGHLNDKGNAMLAEVVEQGLVGGSKPLVPGCRVPPTGKGAL